MRDPVDWLVRRKLRPWAEKLREANLAGAGETGKWGGTSGSDPFDADSVLPKIKEGGK